ncbi:MAG: alpha/beta hydrolase, partial [Oscillospiraceae bacterium]|nr:alpha/beta hydrolase [Oscillospiraceae bacterium]
LVLFYPALCIPDDARSGQMMFAKFDPKNIPQQINCGPMKLGRCYVADVIGMDAVEEIRNYHGPVLIVHGTKDTIVDPDYSRRAREAYPNAKLHMIANGAHSFSAKHDRIAIAHLRRFAERKSQ